MTKSFFMKKFLLLSAFLFVFGGFVSASDIWNPSDRRVSPTNDQVFNDVWEFHAHSEAINALAKEKVIEGYENGQFRPNHRINRVEFLKLMMEGAEIEPNDACASDLYADTESSAWYFGYLCEATRQKVVAGYENGDFKPAEPISFVEGAKIVAEILDLQGKNGEMWYEKYVSALEAKKAIPTSINELDKPLTRGEMAEMMWRIRENKTDKPSVTLHELTSPLPTFESCDMLAKRMAESQNPGFGVSPAVLRMAEPVMMEMMDSSTTTGAPMEGLGAAFEGGGGGQKQFSQTNVQEVGIDEMDLIKNNGDYVFSALDNNQIRILKLQEVPELVATIDLRQENMSIRGMFLDQSKLVVIGNTWDSDWIVPYQNAGPAMAKIAMPQPQNEKTVIRVYEMGNVNAPKLEKEIMMDGNVQHARLKGGKIYTVATQWLGWGDEMPIPFYYSKEESLPMAKCADIRFLPGFVSPNFTILSQLDIRKDEKPKSEVIVGNINHLYMSHTAMYITAPSYNYQHFADFDIEKDTQFNTIFKFDISNAGIDFVAKGRVKGEIKNQWNLSQWGNDLRVATTRRSNKGNTNNNVYVLDENLEQIGALEGLAAGERIYSARFVGPRLYLVTFQQIDPLFVIDLKDGKNPKVLGELKIPGFSEYLHPYDENHIIGFGQEAIANPKNNNAWVTGFKMAMFDVSDVKNPKVKDEVKIGDRGTSSPLLYDHKALLFDKQKNILAFPIELYLSREPQNPQTWGQWAWQGAMVYQINNFAFEKMKELSHQSQSGIPNVNNLPKNSYGDWEKNIQRIIWSRDSLYPISMKYISSYDMNRNNHNQKIRTDGRESAMMPQDLEAMKQEIVNLVQESSCVYDHECEVRGLGTKACGGFDDYVTFGEDMAYEGVEMIENYNELTVERNENENGFSTCDLMIPDEPFCELSKCMFPN